MEGFCKDDWSARGRGDLVEVDKDICALAVETRMLGDVTAGEPPPKSTLPLRARTRGDRVGTRLGSLEASILASLSR